MDLLSEFALVNNKCDLCDSRYVFGGLWLKGINNDLRTSAWDNGIGHEWEKCGQKSRRRNLEKPIEKEDHRELRERARLHTKRNKGLRIEW